MATLRVLLISHVGRRISVTTDTNDVKRAPARDVWSRPWLVRGGSVGPCRCITSLPLQCVTSDEATCSGLGEIAELRSQYSLMGNSVSFDWVAISNSSPFTFAHRSSQFPSHTPTSIDHIRSLNYTGCLQKPRASSHGYRTALF